MNKLLFILTTSLVFLVSCTSESNILVADRSTSGALLEKLNKENIEVVKAQYIITKKVFDGFLAKKYDLKCPYPYKLISVGDTEFKECMNEEFSFALGLPQKFITLLRNSERGIIEGAAIDGEGISGMVYMERYGKSVCPLTPRHMPNMHNGTTNVTNAKWGQVIFEYTWDPLPGENDVFCRSLDLPRKSYAYAFCAEKDGKAVAICLQQMTDDEEMAKQIFESFRWTD